MQEHKSVMALTLSVDSLPWYCHKWRVPGVTSLLLLNVVVTHPNMICVTYHSSLIHADMICVTNQKSLST